LKKLISAIALTTVSLFFTFFLIEISYQGYLFVVKPVTIYTPEGKILNPGGKGIYRGGFTSLDRHGLRNVYDQNALSRKNKFFVVGDSLTFGMGVNDDETFVHHLNEFNKVSEKSFINLGKPGLGTVELVQHFLKFEKEYSYSGGVIWVYYINDAYTSRYFVSIQDLLTHKLSIGYPSSVGYFEKKVWPYLKSPTLLKHITNIFIDKYIDNNSDAIENETWDKYYNYCLSSYYPSSVTAKNEEKYLTDIANYFKQKGTPLYFVLAPMFDQFEDNVIFPQLFVKSIMRKHNIPVLDLWEKLRKFDDLSNYYLPNDHGHWNAQGHQIVAKEIYDFIGLQDGN
jgi:hypothetical protein